MSRYIVTSASFVLKNTRCCLYEEFNLTKANNGMGEWFKVFLPSLVGKMSDKKMLVYYLKPYETDDTILEYIKPRKR